MPNTIAQRIGPNTQVTMIPESAPGTDGATGYTLYPRAATSGGITQALVEAPAYNLSIMPPNAVYGAVTANGTLPLNLDFETTPIFAKMSISTDTKTALATGSLHDFALTTGVYTMPTFGVQYEFVEPPAQYIRAKYAAVKSLATSYSSAGVAPFDVNWVATGDYATTDIASTNTDNGPGVASVFNGTAAINSKNLIGMPQFSWNFDTQAVANPAAFNGGKAVSVTRGLSVITGQSTLAFATTGSGAENDLYMFNLGVNQTAVPIVCVFANGPIATATKFMEIYMPSCFFTLKHAQAAGSAALNVQYDYRAIYDSTLSKIPGYAFGTVLGPYNVGATNNVFTVKIDGGSDITVTLTNGAARTTDQVVSDLNANGPFAAAATADNFLGRVRVTSLTKGTSSSVQFHTGIANGAETILGFVTTAFAGSVSPLRVRFWNATSTAY